AGLAAWLVRRWLLGYDEGHAAATAEQSLGLPAGSVRGVLELGRTVPEGTSPALFQHAEARVAGQLAGIPPKRLTGEAGRHAARRRWRALAVLSGAAVVALALGFASPERSRAAWAPLAHPVAYLKPPALPALDVRPGNARVARGGALDVAVRAPRRRWVQLHWRTPGDVPQSRELDVVRDGARTRLSSIEGPTAYWVTAPDGAVSDTFRITPVDPLLLSDLVVDVSYPAYLQRAAERYDGDVPALELPAGAQLRIRGRGTRLLSRAQLVERASGMRVSLAADADRFSSVWAPSASGTYDWVLTDRDGGGLASTPAPLQLTIVADSAPHVEIILPSEDTTLAPDMHQPVAANAWDDHGLRAASLVSWRASTLGERDAPVEQPLPLGAATDRATLQAVLDATSRRLLPGDTLHFFVRVMDNSPMHQVAVSRVMSLRLPGMDEMRRQVERAATDLLQQANTLTKSAEGLQQDTRNLSRETAAENARNSAGRGGTPDGKGGQPGMSYERSQQAQKVLDRQDELVQKVEALKAQTAQLEKAMQGAGLADPELQARLQELKKLYDQILTPELKAKLEQLRQALAQQDPKQVQQALEELSRQQDQLKKQLDKSLELMRRAAAEQQMNALADKARELAAQEKALSQSMKQQSQNGSPEARKQQQEAAQQQKQLAAQADSLSKAIEQMRQKLQQQGEDQAARQTSAAGKQSEQAQQQMEQAARDAQQQQPDQAAQKGQQAADTLSAAAQSLEQTRRQMAENWKQETQQALQQATNEALSLAQRQASISKKMKEMEQQQDPQGMTPQQLMNEQQNGGSGQQNADEQNAGKSGAQQQAQAQSGGQQQGSQAGGKQNPQNGGQQAGGKKGQGQGGQNGQGGQKAAGGQSQPGGQGSLSALKAEQQALQQSLQQLGQNLSEAGEKSALMNKDVGQALARAMLAMQQTVQALQQQGADKDLPTQQSDQSVDALNQLALALATNGQQAGGSESGTGVPQALEQLADLAKKQGNINGQTSSLMPMAVAPTAMSQQMQGLARQEKDIAQRLSGMANKGGQDQLLGKLDELSRQADQLARDMSGGRLSAELMRRQQELFHRLLDAGRTLEKDEVSNQRVAEAPGDVGAVFGKALDPALLQGGLHYAVPTPEQLAALPPAYRRLILEYFDRLNRAAAEDTARAAAAAAHGSGANTPARRDTTTKTPR
ncbi:MAG TPA: hypothetical protein VF832_03730, partial [Longimicrobiales bacterium]